MNLRKNAWTHKDYAITAAMMMLMGGYYWAIRGTTGYGGETGGMLAGFGWALLWYGLSQACPNASKRPYGSPWILLAISLGIALGGFTGYGIYIMWLRGEYYFAQAAALHEVPAWTGFAMLFVCGLHWGGNTGCFMAWCAPNQDEEPFGLSGWMMRLTAGIGGACAAAIIAQLFPEWFLPYYADGVYANPEYTNCVRAEASLHTIAPHVGSVLGFLLFEMLRGNWRAVKMILTMTFGFAIPFTVGGYWQTRHGMGIDWWKNWEMTIGLGGGLAFGLAFWWFNQPGKTDRPALSPRVISFFRSGLPLWLPSIVVMQGAYDGRCEIMKCEPSWIGYGSIIAVATLVMLIAWRRRIAKGIAAEEYELTPRVIGAFQVFIIAAGILVSIPRQWGFANTVLACAYTFYIGTSLILLREFIKRSRQTMV